MPNLPWWMERVTALLAPGELAVLELGALWRLSQRLQFVRENVDPALLPADFLARPPAALVWAAFLSRESRVREALDTSCTALAGRIRRREFGPSAFRSSWQGLGYVPNDGDSGTPADDYLDGLFHIARFTGGELQREGGSPNMATRAARAADFLEVVEPGADDVVVDLGSGNGKLALTVSASTFTQVVGIEYGSSYVAAARATASELGLQNARFVHADARDVDLSQGSIFYLYYPFQGAVAQRIAQSLGKLAASKAIVVYTSGPRDGYGEHFLREVETGALVLCERRGAFGEVMVLRSNQ